MAALEDFGDAPNHFPPGVTGDGLIMAAEIGALVRKVALRLSTMLGYFVPGAHPGAAALPERGHQRARLSPLDLSSTAVARASPTSRSSRASCRACGTSTCRRIVGQSALLPDLRRAVRAALRIRRAARPASRSHPGCRAPTRRGRSPSAWASIPMGWRRPSRRSTRARREGVDRTSGAANRPGRGARPAMPATGRTRTWARSRSRPSTASS